MLLFIFWVQIASGPTRAELEEKLAVARDTEQIEILNQLAELLVASDPTKSLQYAEDARTQSTELRDPLLKARALKNMGMANQVMGRYEEAQRSLEQALLLLDPETSPLILAECYTTLGLVAENQAHYEQALDYHQQAIQRLAKLETPESLAIQAKAFNGMGIVHYRLGNIQRTLDYFEKSLAVHRRIGNAKGIAGGLNNTGIMLKNLGKYDEALRRYEEALAIQHTQNNYKGMADVLNNMAVLHWLKKDFASCLATHRRSFDMYEQAQDPYGMGLSLGNIAHILGEMGRFSEAEQALTQAFDKADEIGSKELKRNLTKSKATLAERRGRFQEAFLAQKRFSELTESLYQENAKTSLAEMEARFQSREKEREIELLKQRESLQALQAQTKAAEIHYLQKQKNSSAQLRNLAFLALAIISLLLIVTWRRYRAHLLANVELGLKNRELEALDRIVRAINHAQDQNLVWQAIQTHLIDQIEGIEHLDIWLLNPRNQQFEPVLLTSESAVLRGNGLEAKQVEWRFFNKGKEIWPGVFWASGPTDKGSARDEIILAIQFENQMEGFMVLSGRRSGREPDNTEIVRIERFREYVLSALARGKHLNQLQIQKAKSEEALRNLQAAHQNLVQQTTQDVLTELNHRSQMQNEIAKEHHRFQRHQRAFSLVLININRFRNFNSEFGQSSGDQLLKQLAMLLKKNARQSDSLARWDADEFMILLPETDFQGANSILARFQAQLEQQDFHFQSQHVHISVRAGIVESRPQEPIELLMDRLMMQLNNKK